MSQSITAREWSSNCFPEAVKKLLKCYSSSSLYQEGVWGQHPSSRNAAGQSKAICERLLRESDESTTHSLSLSQHNHGYLPLSLSRENALKISGQLVVWKGKKRQEKKGEMWKKIRFIRHMPEICVAEIKAPARPLRVVHREVPESIHGLTVPWNEIYSNTHTCGLPHWVIS